MLLAIGIRVHSHKYYRRYREDEDGAALSERFLGIRDAAVLLLQVDDEDQLCQNYSVSKPYRKYIGMYNLVS